MIKLIKELCERKKISFKSHALVRMVERNIRIDDIVSCLQSAELVREYGDDKPLGSCLIVGFSKEKKPLHVLCAPDEKQDTLWIITVYKPDRKLWSSDFKRRIK